MMSAGLLRATAATRLRVVPNCHYPIVSFDLLTSLAVRNPLALFFLPQASQVLLGLSFGDRLQLLLRVSRPFRLLRCLVMSVRMSFTNIRHGYVFLISELKVKILVIVEIRR